MWAQTNQLEEETDLEVKNKMAELKRQYLGHVKGVQEPVILQKQLLSENIASNVNSPLLRFFPEP